LSCFHGYEKRNEKTITSHIKNYVMCNILRLSILAEFKYAQTTFYFSTKERSLVDDKHETALFTVVGYNTLKISNE